MSKIIFLFLCIFSYSVTAFAQSERQFRIIDSITKEPIPYATVRSIDYKIGTFTDTLGFFTINSSFTDSLIISSVGYVNKKISQQATVGDVVYLEQLIKELQPITVKKRNLIGEKLFGILNGKKSTIWGSGGYGDEFTQKILFPDTNKLYKIKTIAIGAERFDATIPMILHIYSIGKNGLPYQDLLSKKIIITKDHFNKKDKKIIIDITSENMYINEGACFVGVEWLPVPSKGQRLPTTALLLTDEIPERLTYSRAFFYNKDKWSMALSMPGQVNPSNTIISIKVDVFE